ncbi:hypothetical protein ACFLSS_02240 [Bacteroidota bacterium]
MNIFFPENIFTRALLSKFDKKEKDIISFFPSSLLAKKLNDQPDSIALIPTLEIIINQDIYVSHSFGLAFDGILSNTYIYFGDEREQVEQIRIAGDISSMEVIMSKILFKELYNTDAELNISTKTEELINETHILTGDENFFKSKFEGGISFAEEVIELISAPYVNYILASKDKDLLKEYSNTFQLHLNKFSLVESEAIKNIDEKSSAFIKEHSNSVIFNFENQDITGINELVRLTYYHGLIKDLFEVNFV